MSERSEVLIEEWLPVQALGIESRREAAPIPGQFPKLKTIHLWWARRPLTASAAVVLTSLLPAWGEQAAEHFPSEEAYREWVLTMVGILGDPVAARRAQDAALATGDRIPNPYTYKPAFKNSPDRTQLALLERILESTWGDAPTVADVTAGGGSIPFASARLGLPTIANDLNSVAAAILRVAVEYSARYGLSLVDDLRKWGDVLSERLTAELMPFFPADDPSSTPASFLFARTVACPRTGKPVPLTANWWLSKGDDRAAVRLITERDGQQLEAAEFEIVFDTAIDFNAAEGTAKGGGAVSPWDGLAIDSSYIKDEARNGRMGAVMYAVALRKGGRRRFRSPTPTDIEALRLAAEALDSRWDTWASKNVLPTEEVPPGNDTRPQQYGMTHWVDMSTLR